MNRKYEGDHEGTRSIDKYWIRPELALSGLGLALVTGSIFWGFRRITNRLSAIETLVKTHGMAFEQGTKTNVEKGFEHVGVPNPSFGMQSGLNSSKHPIFRICLTGGPCAGKTTSLTVLRNYLQHRGFKVFMIPEAPTMLNKAGCYINIGEMTHSQLIKFEISVMKLQMAHEDIFLEMALNADCPSIIICDRGVMDIKAYVAPSIWRAILNETGWTTIQLRDKRYDAVCHLVTAADGAEEFYSFDNKARYENIEQARERDTQLIDAYTGHPRLGIIDNRNEDGFKGKIDHLIKFISSTTGLSEITPGVTRKYKLETKNNDFLFNAPLDLKIQAFEVEETFLKLYEDNMIDNRLICRGTGDSFIFSHSIVYEANNEKINKARQITAREYHSLISSQIDTSKNVIQKDTFCFIHNKHSFIIDVYKSLPEKLAILRVSADPESKHFELPPFLKISEEITSNIDYATSKLASKLHDDKNPLNY